jgi:uncharacterized membrane protein YccC
MRWLWPTWGFGEIREDFEKSVKAYQEFLVHISEYYQRKGKVPTSYTISRKNAFLETSNLSSAFQEIAQEPKSKLENLDKVYELVELNHTFLSSLASLSTFIRHHETTEASKMFVTATTKIDKNLSLVLRSLKVGISNGTPANTNDDEAFFEQQLLKFRLQQKEPSATVSEELKRYHQEAHLVWEQLRWLYSLSANMLKLTSSMKWDRDL